ncbi:hypothetical protein [Paraburkholderia panacisoli]|uniref:hypothetical protein n=1 Tax=Paraburkholderia panacisoli TaxID=2603818 RepID=UPI00165F775A|nr:hypothetical protein [Paraburkholderia panacisoli]
MIADLEFRIAQTREAPDDRQAHAPAPIGGAPWASALPTTFWTSRMRAERGD